MAEGDQVSHVAGVHNEWADDLSRGTTTSYESKPRLSLGLRSDDIAMHKIKLPGSGDVGCSLARKAELTQVSPGTVISSSTPTLLRFPRLEEQSCRHFVLDRKISMVGSGNRLSQLTSVPPGWPLETVLDAWAHLKCLGLDRSAAAKAAVTDRLEDLWFSEAEEAERWLTRTQTLYHLPPGRDIDQLFPAVYLHAMAELKKWDVRNFTSTGLVRCPSEGPSNCLCHEDCKELAYMLAPHNRSAREAGTGHNLDAADGELREVRIPWWNTMLHSRQFFEFALASMEPPAMHRAAEAEVQLQTELRAARSAVAQLMRRTESLLIEKRRLERRLAETWQEGRRLNGAPHVPVADEQSSVSEVSEASWTLVGDAMSGSAVTENSLSDRLAETTGPCCFVAGTMFKGETGALLRIEDVRQGSRILSADGSVVEVASPPTQNEAQGHP
ncbi:hypothetical protein AK812_SmicGene32574 [Symbiodinium microadriaticum]|uniref:Uncharacterized protein n=1 Tax=Symbiodinium microadriaticum TaxID=2951 RepID=A0A1Q9CTX0_SYMMI|nr:hypothetical protein AK812_SmicGene32574 [Symbiodinium microadriaticum]